MRVTQRETYRRSSRNFWRSASTSWRPPGTPISLAAHKATSTVPIVCVTGDPVGVGLAASLSHPGGNVTGLSLLSGEHSAKWLELLKAAVPKLNRVAILWNPDNPAAQNEMRRLDEAARGLGLALLGYPRGPKNSNQASPPSTPQASTA